MPKIIQLKDETGADAYPVTGANMVDGLANVAKTGSYNDLSNKPTIPTVPTISTDIEADGASDVKTASPKAVKTFVEGKGYYTKPQTGIPATDIANGVIPDTSDLATKEELADKADKDGYYPEMSVGSLKGTEVEAVEGISTVAKSTGIARIKEVKGRSLVWNQMVSDSATEVIVTSGHKYFSNIGGTKSIATSDGTAIAVTGGTDNIIDLTQLFGSGSEPSTVAEFESWLANNIGYRDYYSHNPGEIISNNTEKLEITGLNQWDGTYGVENSYLDANGNPQASSIYNITDYMPVLPNMSYYVKDFFVVAASAQRLCWYDAEKNFISAKSYTSSLIYTSPSNAAYIRLSIARAQASTACLSVSGSRDGEYEPYQKSELELNLSTITGKLNGEGESVTIFPDGLGSVMDAYDRLIVDDDGWCRRAIRTVFSLDLGDLNWTYNKNNQEAFSNNGYASLFASGRNLCAKYTSSESSRPASMPDKSIAINASPLLISGNFSSKEIVIKDSSYTVPADLKASLTGVKLYYEGYPQEYVLDTPIQMTFQAKHGGVIRQLPENGSAPTTAPMRMGVTYALPAEALMSEGSIRNMLEALKSAGIINTYTMAWDYTIGKWTFSFT